MLNARSLAETTLGNTYVHRMDPRTKIFILIAVSFIVVSLDNPKALLFLFISSLFLFFLAASAFDKIKLKVLFILLALMIWGMMFSQAWFYAQIPRTIIFEIIPKEFPILGPITGGLYIYKEGFIYGATQALRAASALTLGLLFAWTTEPSDLLYGLVKLKVPYGLAFMVVTAVRFMPLIISETLTVLTVQKLRGYKPLKLSPSFLKTAFNTLTPILANCVRRAGMLAVSVESRAFRAYSTRTYLKDLTLKKSDLLLIVFSMSVALFILWAKILYQLHLNDIFYSSELRWLYDIAENYL